MAYTITFFVGVGIFCLSIYLLFKSLDFIKTGTRTTATVIELVEKSSSDGRTYAPVFEYKTHFNEKIKYHYPVSSSPASWTVGEEATIVYDNNNTRSVKLLTYFGTFGWTVVLMAIAMPMLVIGGGYYLSQAFLK